MFILLVGSGASAPDRTTARNSPLAKVYELAVPAIVALSADFDPAIRALFRPLAAQFARWVAGPSSVHDQERSATVDQFVRAACFSASASERSEG